jgi:hypothetical protein
MALRMVLKTAPFGGAYVDGRQIDAGLEKDPELAQKGSTNSAGVAGTDSVQAGAGRIIVGRLHNAASRSREIAAGTDGRGEAICRFVVFRWFRSMHDSSSTIPSVVRAFLHQR